MTQCHDPWTLSAPTLILAAILHRVDRTPGLSHIAYVTGDPQKVRGVRTLTTPSPYLGSDAYAAHEVMMLLRNQLLEIAIDLAPLRTFDGDRWSTMDGCLVTVVCREGRVVSTVDEHQFFPAWRYSNHMTVAFEGDVFAVTPHGWTGTLSEACGLLPALTPAG